MEQGSGLRSGISHMSSVIDDGITVNLILVDLNGNSSSVVELYSQELGSPGIVEY
jgi:hypothetical protein